MSDQYSFEDLKKMAKSLLDRRACTTPEGLAAGIKMFHIAWLNLREDATDLDRYQAGLLLSIMHRELGVLP